MSYNNINATKSVPYYKPYKGALDLMKELVSSLVHIGRNSSKT